MSNEDRVYLTRPPGICDSCMRKMGAEAEDLIVLHCYHSRTGVWLRKVNGNPAGLWTAISPIDAAVFVDFIDRLRSDHFFEHPDVPDTRVLM